MSEAGLQGSNTEYEAHVSFLQGWNLAFTDPEQARFESAEEIDRRIAERVTGELEVCSAKGLCTASPEFREIDNRS